jgi:nitric oxide reductase activation protein
VLEALDWLDTDDTPGPRYLVLITDGEPDTCSEPDPQNGQEQALQAAQEAHQRGIEMYVVGVSSDVGVSHL